jgi:hypothetical protein
MSENAVNFHISYISRGVFSHVFTYLNLYRLKVKCGNITVLYTEGAEVGIFIGTAPILTEVFVNYLSPVEVLPYYLQVTWSPSLFELPSNA